MSDTTAPIADGTQLQYLKEDSGRVLDTGLYLTPDEPVTVGLDLTAALAARLIEDGVCEAIAPKTEDTKTEDSEHAEEQVSKAQQGEAHTPRDEEPAPAKEASPVKTAKHAKGAHASEPAALDKS